MNYTLTGKHKTTYEIPCQSHAIDQIKVIKPDGKVFWIPVADIDKIIEILKCDEQMVELNKRIEKLGMVT